jgi:flavodoxin
MPRSTARRVDTVKALVVFDSVHGNTEAIARAIAGAGGTRGGTRALRAGDAKPADLKGVDLLAVGSPTLGGRPTPAVQKFLASIPAGSLAKVRVVAFDTRMGMFIAKLFGWAADRIMTSLAAKGGAPAAKPEGFVVKGREGPLADGEKKRAAAWAKGFLAG